MSITIKRRIAQVGSTLFVLLCLFCLFWPVFLAVGCAAQATSTITPAKADVSDKTVSVTAPVKRRVRVTITVPGTPAPVEEGEDK